MSEVTRVLDDLQQGNAEAAQKLLPLVYDELRRLAQYRLGHETPGQTLQATALVHEAYLRLVGDSDQQRWQGRRHFFTAAAEAMRRILIDRARARGAVKRGGGRVRQDLADIDPVEPDEPNELLAVDEALVKFAAKDPLKAELVKLRFFAGMTLEKAAEVLEISPATADRYWAYARVWLLREITAADSVS